MRKKLNRLLAVAAALFAGFGLQAEMPDGANRTAAPTQGGDQNAIVERATRRAMLGQARTAAADRAKKALAAKGGKVNPALLGTNPMGALMAQSAAKAAKSAKGGPLAAVAVPGPGFQLAQPDYMFSTASNWHNTKPIRKFVDTLPGLGAANANNLGNFIPVAQPIPGVFNDGSDYYEIGVVEYTQQLHSELNPTRLRGYKDLSPNAESTANGKTSSNYLGPVIIAKKDRPVRVKMFNQLPTGVAGDLFIPVDTTMPGAGLGHLGGTETFTQNRAEFHLHGGLNPWISDGTPHQWVTPKGEATSYKKGAGFQNVPDMAAGATDGDGVATYYWTNQQSGRLMFYHDHSFGLTRLNVYAGEAAGYLIVDPVEDKLINAGLLPNNGGGVYNYGIPLIIQDKTFVDTATLGQVGVAGGTDPTWDVNKYGGDGSLWYPHVYMPNQNPADISGANAMGRWDYGPWFWPPLTAAAGLVHGAEPVPGDPNGTEIPGTPNPSLVPEAFMDTPVVNGTAYPKVTVEPKAYRFRILNAANDRFWNLSFFQADASGTEVSMVPSAPGNATWPDTWPTDGRAGGVPDPASAGPAMIQIGNESGLLPAPVVVNPQPVGYNYNRRDIVVLNIQDKALLLGPAERADVVVDFSGYAGKKLILYNDAPAPVPAFDARLDYYTGSPDQRDSGGAAPTQPGFGPNTRTLMLVEVAANTPDPAFNVDALSAAFVSTDTAKGAFAESQHLPIVPQLAYNAALNKPLSNAGPNVSFSNNVYVRIQDNQTRYPFPSMENGDLVQPYLEPKAIQELFELEYGRMNATLGVEIPFTNFNVQTTIPLGYLDPATENLTDGTTQYWKITHNGVDTHPVHFHLFDVQIINRVGWDGAVRLPDANELGWKETVKMNPLEDIIVAFRPLSPRLPFALPNSVRTPDILRPEAATITVTNPVDGNAITVSNAVQNYGWEYVWHCHILGHEENDFMRPMVLTVATSAPAAPSKLVANVVSPTRADLTWSDNSTDETGFSIQRRAGLTSDPFVEIATVVPNVRSYSDMTITANGVYDYQVVAYNQAGQSAATDPFATINAPVSTFSGLVYSVQGGVNVPTPNVTLTFAGSSPNASAALPAGTTVVTDAVGAYTVSLPYNWTGTVTPAAAGYAFTPASLTITKLMASLAAQNFVARPVVTITGKVSNSGAALAGVQVAFSNGGGSATTAADGSYSAIVDSPYTGTATPSLAGFIFSPVSRSYAGVATDLSAEDYAATPVIVISGTIANGATPVPGVTVAASTGQSTTTDANGNYSFTLVAPYTGTITPAKANFAFTPASRSYVAASSDQAVQNFAARPVATISGTVSGLASNAGVTLSFSTGQTVVTNAAGAYALTVDAPYTGTVTPSLPGVTFSPAARSYAGIVADQAAQDYAAQVVISGRVLQGAVGLNGVTITYTGGTTTTNATGNYSFTVPASWSGTVSASRTGFYITPLAASFTSVQSATTQNFTAVVGYTVSGTISTGTPAVGLANVTVNLVGVAANLSATTNASGAYSVVVPTGWTGSITPSLAGYTFAPASRNLNNVTATPAAQNFTATQFFVVSGVITSGATPLSGVTVTFSNGAGTATTNASGAYTLNVAKGWTGTITPTLTGKAFYPASVSVTTALAGPLTQNFNTAQTIAGTTKRASNGANINGVTLTFTGTANGVAINGTVTSATGAYTITVPTGWSGTVTASGGMIGTTPVANWFFGTVAGNLKTATYSNVTANATAQAWVGQ